MATDKQLAEALDRCLDRIQHGEATLEHCLQDHQQLAEELRPLLLAASQARTDLASAGPSKQFRASSKSRVLNLTRARLKQARGTGRRRVLRWRPAYALSALAVLLALLSGVGVAYASEDALPGDSLYGFKRGMEQVSLVINLSPEADARLLLEHADRRVEELKAVLQSGRLSDLDQAISGYQQAVDAALAHSGSDPDRLQAVDQALSAHETTLLGVLERAPDQAAPAIEHALEQAQHGRQTVEAIRSGEHPSELAPGQLKKSGEGDDELPPGQLKQDDCARKTPGPPEDAGPPESPGQGRGRKGACKNDLPED